MKNNEPCCYTLLTKLCIKAIKSKRYREFSVFFFDSLTNAVNQSDSK